MDELKPHRCRGTNRHGAPCGNSPIPGGFVCRLHGGGAPQVQRSAKARLLAGADLAVDYLLNLLTPKLPCERCGRSDADRDPVVVRACQLVLDRSGFHPTLAIEHAVAPDKYAHLSIDEFIEHIETLLYQARALRDDQRKALSAEPVPGYTRLVLNENAAPTPIQRPDVQIPVATHTNEEGISAPR